MGYLRKVGDKKFRIMYDVMFVNGKRRQKTETLVGVTKKQAEAILAKRKAAVVAGEYLPCADMTMNELFDRFMQAKEGRLAATTLQRYESLLRLYLRPAVGTRKVGSVKAVDLLATYARWSKRPVSGRTVHHAAELLRNVLRRAVKWEVILRSPAASLDADDLPRASKTRIGGTHRNRGAAVATGGEIPNPSVHGAALLDGAKRLLSCRGICTLHRSPSRRNHGDALARRRFSSADRHNQPIAELDEAGRAYLQTAKERQGAHGLCFVASARDSRIPSRGAGC